MMPAPFCKAGVLVAAIEATVPGSPTTTVVLVIVVLEPLGRVVVISISLVYELRDPEAAFEVVVPAVVELELGVVLPSELLLEVVVVCVTVDVPLLPLDVVTEVCVTTPPSFEDVGVGVEVGVGDVEADVVAGIGLEEEEVRP